MDLWLQLDCQLRGDCHAPYYWQVWHVCPMAVSRVRNVSVLLENFINGVCSVSDIMLLCIQAAEGQLAATLATPLGRNGETAYYPARSGDTTSATGQTAYFDPEQNALTMPTTRSDSWHRKRSLAAIFPLLQDAEQADVSTGESADEQGGVRGGGAEQQQGGANASEEGARGLAQAFGSVFVSHFPQGRKQDEQSAKDGV